MNFINFLINNGRQLKGSHYLWLFEGCSRLWSR